MRSYLLLALLLSACGAEHARTPATTARTPTPTTAAGTSVGDPNEIVCTDDDYGPRGSVGRRCRRRGEIDADKREMKDQIEHSTLSNRSH